MPWKLRRGGVKISYLRIHQSDFLLTVTIAQMSELLGKIPRRTIFFSGLNNLQPCHVHGHDKVYHLR